MVFNSLEFVVFFVVVLAANAVLSRPRQNVMLLLSSYLFYGVWDYRFLALLIFTTVVDYYIAIWIARTSEDRRRKQILLVSLVVNLGVLGFFKYFNFFADSLVDLAATVDLTLSPTTLNVILPVGVSFYTFQSMSYTIDVYRRKIPPAGSLVEFALFVAFFPQLVAGPIERAASLLPQIAARRTVTIGKVGTGLYLILLGLFKKVVVADNLAPNVDTIFSAPNVTGEMVVIGSLYFAFQIYCDFSGYSDIARGAARMLGFNLMVNFRQPFFAENPGDLMRRWHISLSAWMRDYVFQPLGGSRGGNLLTFRNLTITMVLGGLWHGAAWNFALWGVYLSVIMIGYRLYEIAVKPRVDAVLADKAWMATPRTFAAILTMFSLNLYGFMTFRCSSLAQVVDMTAALATYTSLANVADLGVKFVALAAPVIILDYLEYRKNAEELPTESPLVLQAAIYASVLLLFLMIGQYDGAAFIYFQF